MEGRILACSFLEGRSQSGGTWSAAGPLPPPVPCRSPSGGRAGCFTSRRRAARRELHVDLSSGGLAPSPDQLARTPGGAQHRPVEQ